MEEEWRTIPGIETHEVSNMGRVRSKDRISKVAAKGLGGRGGTVEYERKLRGRLLSPHYTDRYIQYCINDRAYLAHRLVATAFLEKSRPEQNVVNHKDGNTRNNSVDNLEWCTSSENEKYSYDHLGKQIWNKGKHYVNHVGLKTRRRNHMQKCLDMLEAYEKGQSAATLAFVYKRTRTQIYTCLTKARKYREEHRDKDNEQV